MPTPVLYEQSCKYTHVSYQNITRLHALNFDIRAVSWLQRDKKAITASMGDGFSSV